MAQDNEDIQVRIKTAIDASNSIATIGELKKSYRELQSLALEVGDQNTESFNQVASAAGQVKDRISDMNAQISAVSGSSIENLNGSIGLVSSSIKNLDFGQATAGVKQFTSQLRSTNVAELSKDLKSLGTAFLDLGKQITSSIGENLSKRFDSLKESTVSFGTSAKKAFSGDLTGALSAAKGGFESLGNAIKFNPLFLIASAVLLIIANFEKLKDAGGALGALFVGIGTIIKTVTQGFKDLSDAIGLTSFATQKQIELDAIRGKEDLERLERILDTERKIRELRGESTASLDVIQFYAQLDKVTKDIRTTLEEINRKGIDLTDSGNETVKKLKELRVEEEKLLGERRVNAERFNKESEDNYNSSQDRIAMDRANLIKDESLRATKILEIQKATEERAIQQRVNARKSEQAYNSRQLSDYQEQLENAEEEIASKGMSMERYRKVAKIRNLIADLSEINTESVFAEKGLQEELSVIDRKYAQERYKINLEARQKQASLGLELLKIEEENITKEYTSQSNVRLEYQIRNWDKQMAYLEKNKGLLFPKEYQGGDPARIKADNDRRNSLIAAARAELNNKELKAAQEFEDYKKKIADDGRDVEIERARIKSRTLLQTYEVDKRNLEAKYLSETLLEKGNEEERELIRAKNKLLDEKNAKDLFDLRMKLQKDLFDAEVANAQNVAEAAKAISEANPFSLQKQLDALQEEQNAKNMILQQGRAEELAAADRLGQNRLDIIRKYDALELENKKKTERAKTEAIRDAVNRGLQLAQYGVNAGSALNDLITQSENQRLKKGEKLTVETQKKQFRRTQALGVVNTGISTAQAIMQALAQLGPVAGGIAAGLIGTTGAIQIATILSKKFEPDTDSVDTGAGGSTGAVNSISIPGATDTSASNISAPTLFGLGTTNPTSFQGAGLMRAYVVESDISAVQRNVQRIDVSAQIR